MGLDSFAIIPKTCNKNKYERAPDEPFINISLCGGLFSKGEGSSSFRGKVYDAFVAKVTGISLYNEYISEGTVKKMAKDLRGFKDSVDKGIVDWEPYSCDNDICINDLNNLVKYWEICAENNYAIAGWW